LLVQSLWCFTQIKLYCNPTRFSGKEENVVAEVWIKMYIRITFCRQHIPVEIETRYWPWPLAYWFFKFMVDICCITLLWFMSGTGVPDITASDTHLQEDTGIT